MSFLLNKRRRLFPLTATWKKVTGEELTSPCFADFLKRERFLQISFSYHNYDHLCMKARDKKSEVLFEMVTSAFPYVSFKKINSLYGTSVAYLARGVKSVTLISLNYLLAVLGCCRANSRYWSSETYGSSHLTLHYSVAGTHCTLLPTLPAAPTWHSQPHAPVKRTTRARQYNRKTSRTQNLYKAREKSKGQKYWIQLVYVDLQLIYSHRSILQRAWRRWEGNT